MWPCRWLSLTTVSSGAMLRSSRRCHRTPPPHRTPCMRSVPVGAPRAPNRTLPYRRCAARCSTTRSDIQAAHRPCAATRRQRPRLPDRTESRRSWQHVTTQLRDSFTAGGQGHEPGHRRAEHGSLRFDVGGTPASARLTQHAGHIGRRAKRAHPRTRNRPVLNMRGEPWNTRTMKTSSPS